MILHDIFEQREPYQKAIDALEQHYIDGLRKKIGYLEQSLAQARTMEERQAIQKRIKEYQQEIVKQLSANEAQQTPGKPQPGQGIGDIQDPRVKMAQLQQKNRKGPLANVAAGLKAFVKGEPEPLGEQELGRRGIGVRNMKALQATIEQGLARTEFQFATGHRMFADEDDSDKLADYYNGMDSAGRTNFVYNVMSDPVKFVALCKQLGVTLTPVAAQQPDLPGIPSQGELPLSEKRSQKKKFKSTVAQREIEKAMAAEPAAGSPIEAFILKSIENDQAQSQQIQDLETKIQSLRATTAPTAKTAAPTPPTTPRATTVGPTPAKQPTTATTAPEQPATTVGIPEPTVEPAPAPDVKQLPKKDQKILSRVKRIEKRLQDRVDKYQTFNALKDTTPAQLQSMQKQINDLTAQLQAQRDQLSQPTKLKLGQDDIWDVEASLVRPSVSRTSEPISAMTEHGGGIGPRQHWQSLMRNEQAQDRSGKPMYQAREKFLVRHNGRDVAFFPDMEQAKVAAQEMQKDLKGYATVHRVMREGEMSKIDIMRQDLKLMSDLQFLRAHGMSKVVFQQKYRSLLKPAPQQDVPMEGTAQQFGQAVRMAGYTGRELEKDPAYKKSVQHARQEREQSQRNIERVQRGYGEDPEDYNDLDEMFNLPGTTIPRKSIIQGYTVFFNPETRTVSVTRGGDSEEAAIEQARIGTVNLKTFRNAAEKLIDRIEDQIVNEGVRDTTSATAVIACLLAGGTLSGCATAPEKTTTAQVVKTGQDVGRVIYNAKNITKAGTEEEVRQELKNIARGMSGRPQELNHSNILRIWRRINAPKELPPQPPQNEAVTKQPRTKQELLDIIDKIQRMSKQERNPANLQIMRKDIELLKKQYAHLKEDTAALAAEDAILKRIFVRHKDLMMEYGPDKITQAAEAVAYNVGDIAHITDDDINGWIGQVEQILGARP